MYLIISDSGSFPWGMAASTRIRNIAKAIIYQGGNVAYIGLHGAYTDFGKSKVCNASHHGVKYYYPGGFSVRSRNWFVRRLDDFLGKWLTLRKIREIRKQDSVDVVIIYSRAYGTVMFWTKMLRRMNIKVILELCEWPMAKALSNKRYNVNSYRFCTQAVLKVDAVLPISSYIEDEVLKIGSSRGKNIHVFKIPILTDLVNTKNLRLIEKSTDSYILYSGSVEYIDITYFVMDVVYEMKMSGYGLKLKFTGYIEKGLAERIQTYIEKKNINELIEFTGYLPESELFESMMNAVCLLAPLPETEQSKARFPTKIGFYLSSGRPVVTTAVGSVNEYLTDGINAYVAEKFEPKGISGKIVEIITDTARADKVGLAGQALAIEKFYYQNACQGLVRFLENIGSGS